MPSQNPVTPQTLTFSGALTLLFIALKLLKYITWPWWIVLMPAYATFALVLVIYLVLYILFRLQ
jgi:hypothetical protein